ARAGYLHRARGKGTAAYTHTHTHTHTCCVDTVQALTLKRLASLSNVTSLPACPHLHANDATTTTQLYILLRSCALAWLVRKIDKLIKTARKNSTRRQLRYTKARRRRRLVRLHTCLCSSVCMCLQAPYTYICSSCALVIRRAETQRSDPQRAECKCREYYFCPIHETNYDIRGKHSEKPNQWMVEYLNQRAYFQTRKYPATLNINHVQEDDEGEYRCRVDFLKSPTRNSRVKLDIIIPPARPNIVNEQGKTVGTLAGPYVEGGDMKLSCSVSGGRPEPVVRWWRGEMLLDATVARGDLVKRSTLVVRNLTRSDLHAKFTCQASNNNISQPVSASVAIDMYLSPLNVTILTSEDAPLSAGRQYEITCITVGSRPAANLSWYMEGQSLKNFTQKVSSDGNMTTSNLTFTPTKSDNGTSITCRAENPNVKAAVMEDTLKLNVFYVPTLTLSLGSNMNPDDIEEGDDVYFDCKVDANPSAYKVVWKHNGIVLQNNAKLGMIVQQTSLALRKVNRSQAGNYTCIASNVEGDGYSNIVELKIMYKPICVQDQKRIYGVARHEEARVLCQVEAYPPPDSFRWAFNNTEEMNDVSSARHSDSTISAQSVLTYKPVSETDYGTVLCWASNTAGQQKNACIFHIIAAGKPEPPYNCTLMNQTTQSLSVECTAGFDGGQTQHFQLEVFDQLTGQLRANVSSRDSATFHVHELEPGRVLRMSVYAVNAKGRSEATLLEGFTLKVAEKQTVRVLFTGTPVPFEITPLLGILIGCLGVMLFCTVAVLLAMKLRSDRRGGGGHQRPGDLPLKKSAAPSSEDLYDPDDRNPDVVPTNKGSTAGTPLAVQPTPDSLTSTTTTALPPPSQLVANHLPNYSHNDYNNYPTLPVSLAPLFFYIYVFERGNYVRGAVPATAVEPHDDYDDGDDEASDEWHVDADANNRRRRHQTAGPEQSGRLHDDQAAALSLQGGDDLREHRSHRDVAARRRQFEFRGVDAEQPARQQRRHALSGAIDEAAPSPRSRDREDAPDIEPRELRIGQGYRRPQRQRILRLIASTNFRAGKVEELVQGITFCLRSARAVHTQCGACTASEAPLCGASSYILLIYIRHAQLAAVAVD
ncbi:unnamed protein product, partial [Trichogramma brassicae]